MLRPLARLCLCIALPLCGCERPPAGETTPPGNADASSTAEPAEPEPTEAPLPPAEQVLARAVDAVGGRAAIDAIQSSYTETSMEIAAQNISMSTQAWSKGQDSYVESDLPGVGKTQIWKKGEEIWSKDPINGLRKLEGAEADQTRWSSDPMLAAHWDKYFATATTTGRNTVEGQAVVEVELVSEDGTQRLVLLFDEQTAMPAGMAFEQQTPMGSAPVRIILDDFREVAGVKIPFRAVTSMPLMNMVQVTQKHEVNIEIEDGKFAPPTPGAAPEPEPEVTDQGKGKGKGKSKSKSKSKSKGKAKTKP